MLRISLHQEASQRSQSEFTGRSNINTERKGHYRASPTTPPYNASIPPPALVLVRRAETLDRLLLPRFIHESELLEELAPFTKSWFAKNEARVSSIAKCVGSLFGSPNLDDLLEGHTRRDTEARLDLGKHSGGVLVGGGGRRVTRRGRLGLDAKDLGLDLGFDDGLAFDFGLPLGLGSDVLLLGRLPLPAAPRRRIPGGTCLLRLRGRLNVDGRLRVPLGRWRVLSSARLGNESLTLASMGRISDASEPEERGDGSPERHGERAPPRSCCCRAWRCFRACKRP